MNRKQVSPLHQIETRIGRMVSRALSSYERARRAELSRMLTIKRIAGQPHAILHEAGKIDITQPIPDAMLPFFRALINVLRGIR